MSLEQERTRLIASHNEASSSYDKTLLTLCSGALGLSIVFVKDIASNPTERWLLLTSWICLGMALLVITFSHMTSVEIHKRLLDGLESARPYDREPWWVKNAVTWMNRAAGGLFAAGMGFLIAFAFINFNT